MSISGKSFAKTIAKGKQTLYQRFNAYFPSQCVLFFAHLRAFCISPGQRSRPVHWIDQPPHNSSGNVWGWGSGLKKIRNNNTLNDKESSSSKKNSEVKHCIQSIDRWIILFSSSFKTSQLFRMLQLPAIMTESVLVGPNFNVISCLCLCTERWSSFVNLCQKLKDKFRISSLMRML